MKDNINFDELLNGYIDDQLSPRHHTEVQRLLLHDPKVVQRLEELKRCKVLVSSLPAAEAPPGLVEDVKAALERKTLLGEHNELQQHRAGARYLLQRKLFAVAAMFALIAVLGILIYTIVAPQQIAEKPIAFETPQPAEEILLTTPKPTAVATAEKTSPKPAAPRTSFTGTLVLATTTPDFVRASLNRAINANVPLMQSTLPPQDSSAGLYIINSSEQNLIALMTDLKNIWSRLDSPILSIEDKQTASRTVVTDVTPDQFIEIINQDTLQDTIAVAKNFALSNLAEPLPDKEVFAARDDKTADSLTPPKPLLTSGKDRVKKTPLQVQGRKKVRLTIVIIPLKNNDPNQ